MNNLKILVIENQETQFLRIKEFLPEPYKVFPKDFIVFMDNIRVVVNKKYPLKYREEAFDFVFKVIREEGIELILMDHILGGAHHCDTGIDLATQLGTRLKEEEERQIPVLFLSKTDPLERNRVEKFEEYKKNKFGFTDWIYKGHFGDEILTHEYFKKYVMPIIENALKSTSSTCSCIEVINDIILDKDWARTDTLFSQDGEVVKKLKHLIIQMENASNHDCELINELNKMRAEFYKPPFTQLVDRIISNMKYDKID